MRSRAAFAIAVLVTSCSRDAPHAAPPLVAAAAPERGERAVIRRAEIELDADDPASAMNAAVALAEELHGFAADSELRHAAGEGDTSPAWISLTLRVPAADLATAMARLRRLATNVPSEKITGQDVTEEVVDVDARVRTQRALEAQFLDILKRATTIKEALEVHTQLAQVRGEIEKLEGRQRMLARETTLATIHVQIRGRTPVVARSFGFADALRGAAHDVVAVSAALATGAIRIAGVATPVALLVGLPLLLVLRRRRRRSRSG